GGGGGRAGPPRRGRGPRVSGGGPVGPGRRSSLASVSRIIVQLTTACARRHLVAAAKPRRLAAPARRRSGPRATTTGSPCPRLLEQRLDRVEVHRRQLAPVTVERRQLAAVHGVEGGDPRLAVRAIPR